MLSEKDNFLKALGGEIPEYVPRYDIMWGISPSCLNGERVNGVGKDIYGVNYTNEGSAVPGALPEPGNFILQDITKWRDVIKFPDLSDVNWELMAQRDLAKRNPNLPLGGSTGGGIFQRLMAFMGFNEGLVACITDPDEVKELCHYLIDNALSVADKYLYYYKPDYISGGDDIAHERQPFVSLEMFRDIFAPEWARYIKFFKDEGLLAVHHNCGHFEAFLEDVVKMGYNAWEPVQNSNDAVGLKAKYGKSFMLIVVMSSAPLLAHNPGITKADVYNVVKGHLDKLAPGGGFGFMGSVMGSDPVSQERNKWLGEVFEELRVQYY